jgi:hypothetical protein
VLSTASLVGTAPGDLKTIVTPSSHLGLFMGRNCLTRVWPQIVAWLDRPEPAQELQAPEASGAPVPEPPVASKPQSLAPKPQPTAVQP